jgi:hypothetical protein
MCSPGWATAARRQPERSGAPSQQCSPGWATAATRQTGKGDHPQIAQIFADGETREVECNKSAQSASSADQKKALSPSPAWFFYLRGFVPLCEKF